MRLASLSLEHGFEDREVLLHTRVAALALGVGHALGLHALLVRVVHVRQTFGNHLPRQSLAGLKVVRGMAHTVGNDAKCRQIGEDVLLKLFLLLRL